MNANEIDRIADALHHARPDWPAKQLRTLLADPKMADRPRRDVFVALAWVACESGTASPYRVLEAGPWWKAAAVDGGTANNPRPSRGPWCALCAVGKDDPKHPDDDHPFTLRPAGASEQARAEARELLVAAGVRVPLPPTTPLQPEGAA